MASHSNRVSILIVDDHALVRDGLKQLVGQHFGNAHIGEATNGAVAIELAQQHDWDIVLLDNVV